MAQAAAAMGFCLLLRRFPRSHSALMAEGTQRKVLLISALAALAAVWPAEAQTTLAPPGFAPCNTYACPSGYKYRGDYESRTCLGVCDLYDRDFCCRKNGWPAWAWALLALGIFYCLHACCCPACAIPCVGGLLGGKKKKKKKKKSKARDGDSSSSWSSDEYVVHPAVY